MFVEEHGQWKDGRVFLHEPFCVLQQQMIPVVNRLGEIGKLPLETSQSHMRLSDEFAGRSRAKRNDRYAKDLSN